MKLGVIIISDGQTRFAKAVEMLRSEADHVCAIQNSGEGDLAGASVKNPVPLSWAENLNLGWQVFSRFDVVVISNSDIIVPGGWRAPLEEALERNPKLGAVSLPTDNPPRKPGPFPTTPLVFTAIRRSVVTWFPPFDERLVNFGEDLDFSHRLAINGWLHEIVDGPLVRHDTELQREHSFKSGLPTARSTMSEFSGIYGPNVGDELMQASG